MSVLGDGWGVLSQIRIRDLSTYLPGHSRHRASDRAGSPFLVACRNNTGRSNLPKWARHRSAG